MAIIQISRITQRKGLQEDLPQLAGAEFGWSVDERRLFIGNGTLEEGAPVIGNTEILTEFSDILAVSQSYTYKGLAAGYAVQTGPTPGTPVSQSLQSWMDQWASVKDFGAVGDGVTDDTEAINRALYQLYCREVNPQVRRSLFFPAGVYLVSETIIIPPYAMLYGEGPNSSAILLATTAEDSTLNAFVIRTGDSLQQIGDNIGTNGATPPTDIVLHNMGFSSLDLNSNIFLIEDANNIIVSNVTFLGPLTTNELTVSTDDISCVRFASTSSLVTNGVKFENCQFTGCTYGINTAQEIKSCVVSASSFNTLYQGVVLAESSPVNGGPTGVSITNCEFDNIYSQGIIFGLVSLNASAQNVFYDVGNHFGGVTQPYTSIIDIQTANNISVGDMFARDASFATIHPRINLNDTSSIAFTNAEQLAMGVYVRKTGVNFDLLDDQSSAQTIFTITNSQAVAFQVNYTIVRDTSYRTGMLTVSTDGASANLNYNDDYVENASTGITLTVTQSSTTISVKYTSSATGIDGIINYSITYLA